MGSLASINRFISAIIIFSVCAFVQAHANNLSIENVTLSDPDSNNQTMSVSLDISWDNSWKNSINNDSVWIFMKYSTDSGTTWNHATLYGSGTNPSGYSNGLGTELEIVVPTDKKGCFFQRSSSGSGSVNTDSIEILWDWGIDGLDAEDSARIKIFGIEMVYVPQGEFYLGDGNGLSESQYAFFENGVANTAALISDSNVTITCDSSLNDDIDTSPVVVNGENGITGNENYPVGYNAFYVMKYEITEGQWVDFFNTLTNVEKSTRDITSSNGKNSDSTVNRNTVSWTTGSASTLREDRACGYISWPDLCAYADWAALRPMTELEFEKILRGSEEDPVYEEFAWGNTQIIDASTISGAENGNEIVSNAGANSCSGNNIFSGGDGGSGPLRAGIFATSSSSRQSAGASYYGAMELSGNLWERCVTLGNASGRSFSGTHGDGTLVALEGYEGNASNSDWPGFVNGQGVTAANGSGLRGGSWQEVDTSKLAISGRSEASITTTARSSDNGGRCVRSVF